MKKKSIILLLTLAIGTSIIPAKETKADPQIVVQQTVENAPAFGPLAPIIIIGGLIIAGGVTLYEMVKIPHLPDTGSPNSRAIKYHPKTNEPIQYRYYDENGDVRLDIDLTDHGNPEYHPYVPHKHTYENGKRITPGQPLTDVEKEFYLGGD